MYLKKRLTAAVCGSLLLSSAAVWADTVSTPLAAYTMPSINELGISADGSRLLSVYLFDSKAILWNAATGAKINEISVGHPTNFFTSPAGAAFSADGNSLAVSYDSGQIILWNLADGTARLTLAHGSSDSVGSLAFSADGRSLASASRFATPVIVWDTTSGNKLREWNEAGNTFEVTLSPDGRTLAAVVDDGVVLRNTADGSLLRTLSKPNYAASKLAFSPDGQTLAVSASSFAAASDEIQLWDVAGGTIVRAINTGNTQITGDDLAFSADGRLLAQAGSDNNNFKLWDTTTGTEVRTHTDTVRITDVVFAPDGSQVYSAASDFGSSRPFLKVWEVPGATVASQCAAFNLGQAPHVTVPCLQIGDAVYNVGLNVVSAISGSLFEADLSLLQSVSLTPGADCAVFPYQDQNVLRLNCVDVGGVKHSADLGLRPNPAAIQFELIGAAPK